MQRKRPSRREFLSGSVTAAAGLAAIANPGRAAAQAVGVKPADLPNLTIREVRVYHTDLGSYHSLNGERGELVGIVTEGGLEGNYTLGNRNATPNWLEWAKPTLVGKNVMDVLPTLCSTSGLRGTYGFNGEPYVPPGQTGPRWNGGQTFHRAPGVGHGSAFDTDALNGSGLMTEAGGSWPNWYAAAADVCLWDILGKVVNQPVYKLLSGGCGGTKDKIMAYASSTHHPAIEDYAPEVVKVKADGFKGYKIHPGPGEHRDSKVAIQGYIGHMEIIKQVRAAAGDEFMLAHDPVQQYNRYEAVKVGRLLDELDYAWFEDPIRTTDEEGLIELAAALDLPLHVGEFLYSISDFAGYISRGALDVVRLIADNTGGISGSMRVGLLADAFGLECTPHNWGNTLDLALHFHLELALPNAMWFEMPYPPSLSDHPYFDYKFRPDKDGYVHAPTEPGLGYPINRAELDKVTKRIDR
ncbi:MAG TPA: mandelate racemase/muconate lactonizing enzyme family protein [Acidobacteriaceae bacterium]|nr:mandelate racemase/muconate lactonizing enzyme family protein [Acidobacteriaceae bacterium]